MSIETAIEKLAMAIERVAMAIESKTIGRNTDFDPPETPKTKLRKKETTPTEKIDKEGLFDSPSEKQVEVAPEPKKEITITDVRNVAKKVIDDFGSAAAVKLLAKFGAKKVPEIKVEDYPAFIAAAEDLG